MAVTSASSGFSPWGNHLKKMTRKQGRSLLYVSKKLRVSRSTLWRWMKEGNNDPWVSKNLEQILNEPGSFERFHQYEI